MSNTINQILSAKYSVVVPSHKRPAMLKKALDSIAYQTVLPQKVYLVIDEAEGEYDYSYLSDYNLDLHIMFTGGGHGGASARNLGLEQISNEEYIFFLDDDDEWCPSKMEKQLEYLEKNKSIIGVTCWNYKIGRRTDKVKRPNAKIINKYIVIWNTLGSFSFFGYRVTSETKGLRLCKDLSAAQDWEFYMQLSNFGEFSVIEEYLVRYYEHDGNRITGNASRKACAWKTVYQKHRNHMSLRQRWFHLARINWKNSEMSPSVPSKISYSLLAILLSILSFHQIYTLNIIKSSTSSVLRGMGIKK